MRAGDLTSLQPVKDWLGISNSANDANLSRLISSVSATIRSEINRYSLIGQTFTEIRDGMGTNSLVLKNWPVNEILSLTIGNSIIRPGNELEGARSAGWYLTPYDGFPPGNAQTLELLGYTYYYGKQNVRITYNAGYVVSDESFAVPSNPYVYVVSQSMGSWAADGGIRYASTGNPLVLVTGTPGIGQYAISPTIIGGYILSSDEVGVEMLVSYSFTPSDLEGAAIEWVAERERYRNRIGVRSKSLAGQEHMSYDLSGVPPFVESVIGKYRSVLTLL